ncbi:unnamed protein product [Heligmosomoides polygyrus]|uniref:EB domain-containing protein n=1 Tax=Heligmosomoides polygyrus TaxID=6339 RepID=A0A3P7YTU8_HELPZ|nr:unnamed protein product [Heligmosomoides polygyrus]
MSSVSRQMTAPVASLVRRESAAPVQPIIPPSAACSSSMCGSGQVYVNGQCMSTVPIGSMCQVTQQCRGGSTCVNSRCQCPNGAAVTSNGECSNTGSSCQLGTVMVNGQCVSLASPGMSCVAQEQCIDNSVCMGNICNCNQGYSLIAGYCIRYTGGPCQQTQTLVNGQCVTYSVVSGPCMADAQCVGGSTCQNGVCSCKTGGATALYGKCSSPECGQNQVSADEDCSNYTMFSTRRICVSAICSFVLIYLIVQIYVNMRCYPLVIVGSSCSLNEQCTGNSQCTNGYCQCPNGGTASNGMCATQSTNCKGYQVAINNQCLDKVSIGQSCSNYAQCPGNGIYLCSQGSVSVSGRCLNLVQLGQSCTYSEQCMGFSACTSSVCSCRTGSSAINGVCRSLIGCGTNQVLIQNQCYPLVQV